MAILDIVLYPEKVLRETAEPVDKVDDQIRQLLSDMAETMYAAPGIGLAAPQIGILKRIIVVDTQEREDPGDKTGLLKLINPELLEQSGEIEMEEGCLSLPGITENVKRPGYVKIKALNEDGQEVVLEATGLLSVCLQHEIDHLNGVLFIDHLSRLKRNMLKSKLKKISRLSE